MSVQDELTRQGLEPADGMLIAADLEFNTVLTSLNLSENFVGPELGIAMAEALNTSVRTKAAYAYLKSVNPDHPWGNPRIDEARELAIASNKQNAKAHNTNTPRISKKVQELQEPALGTQEP